MDLDIYISSLCDCLRVGWIVQLSTLCHECLQCCCYKCRETINRKMFSNWKLKGQQMCPVRVRASEGTNEFLFSEYTCSPAFSHSQPSWCRLASGGINWIDGELTENCCGCDGDNATVMRELTSCARLAVTSNRLWRPRELRGFALLDSRHSSPTASAHQAITKQINVIL